MHKSSSSSPGNEKTFFRIGAPFQPNGHPWPLSTNFIRNCIIFNSNSYLAKLRSTCLVLYFRIEFYEITCNVYWVYRKSCLFTARLSVIYYIVWLKIESGLFFSMKYTIIHSHILNVCYISLFLIDFKNIDDIFNLNFSWVMFKWIYLGYEKYNFTGYLGMMRLRAHQ